MFQKTKGGSGISNGGKLYIIKTNTEESLGIPNFPNSVNGENPNIYFYINFSKNFTTQEYKTLSLNREETKEGYMEWITGPLGNEFSKDDLIGVYSSFDCSNCNFMIRL